MLNQESNINRTVNITESNRTVHIIKNNRKKTKGRKFYYQIVLDLKTNKYKTIKHFN